jgi:hypothetical protein
VFLNPKTSIRVETSQGAHALGCSDDRHFIDPQARSQRAAFLVSRSPERAVAVSAISPRNEPPVLSRLHFDGWGERYLDSGSESRARDPAGVKTPLGPFSEIVKAWHGQLAYDPSRVAAPVAIIRGEWG